MIDTMSSHHQKKEQVTIGELFDQVQSCALICPVPAEKQNDSYVATLKGNLLLSQPEAENNGQKDTVQPVPIITIAGLFDRVQNVTMMHSVPPETKSDQPFRPDLPGKLPPVSKTANTNSHGGRNATQGHVETLADIFQSVTDVDTIHSVLYKKEKEHYFRCLQSASSSKAIARNDSYERRENALQSVVF